jgi:hypothetical protein
MARSGAFPRNHHGRGRSCPTCQKRTRRKSLEQVWREPFEHARWIPRCVEGSEHAALVIDSPRGGIIRVLPQNLESHSLPS